VLKSFFEHGVCIAVVWESENNSRARKRFGRLLRSQHKGVQPWHEITDLLLLDRSVTYRILSDNFTIGIFTSRNIDNI